MNFDFLKNVELVVPETTKAVTRNTADKTPEGLALRVFANGKVYPSAKLVSQFGLEYANKDSVVKTNGLDVFKSADWPMFPVNPDNPLIFIAPVSKGEPKIDLFGQVGYNEDNTPKNSVMEQGGGSFGKELVEMVESVYGITLEKGEYVDLEVKEEYKIKSPNDVYYIPKTVTRGARKGETSVIRRENIDVMPLAPIVDKKEEEPTQGELEFPEKSTEEKANEYTNSLIEEIMEGEEMPEAVPESGEDLLQSEPSDDFSEYVASADVAVKPEGFDTPTMPQMPSLD